jgi:hypothetical protein
MELGARPVERGRFRLDRGLTPPLRDDQRDDPNPRNGTGKQQRMTSTLGSQSIVILTAHPLQRVGAFALAALVRASYPHELTEAAFDEAMRQIADHALAAARTRDTKSPEGLWLKCGMSLFPNAPSTHNNIYKKSDAALETDIRGWFTRPGRSVGDCVLCGRAAVAFFRQAGRSSGGGCRVP